MKYTVVTTAIADFQLAKIWVDAADRQSVTDAYDRLESLLRQNASSRGRLHPGGWRVISEPPITLSFSVSEDDRLVKILSVGYRP
jgi:hypothetical protein